MNDGINFDSADPHTAAQDVFVQTGSLSEPSGKFSENRQQKSGQPQAAEHLFKNLEAAERAIGIASGDCNHSASTGRTQPRFKRKSFSKLIIQIPCYNEAATLGITLAALPRQIEGVAKVEWLVVDDGSSDRTAELACELGVDHVVRLPRNQGLARAFQAGIEAAIRHGADIIVNTDADNQYCGADIQKLVDPIVAGQAEFVVGARPIGQTPHFSKLKKALQWLGSWVVRRVSKTEIPDAPSGFRAMSRATAMQLNVFSDYTYTLETIIQAGQKNMAITSVPIRTNPDLRPSRLLRSIPSYVIRSASTIVRIFMTYRPFQFFALPGCVLCLASLLLCFRYLTFYFSGSGSGHIQSLILAALIMGLGLTGVVVGLVADLISVNRKLLEKVDWRVRQLEEHFREQRPAADAGDI